MPPEFKKWLESADFFECHSLEGKFERAKHHNEFGIISSFMSRRQMYISSWHIGHHESAAMWKVYGASNLGVAITSTPHRLSEALAQSGVRLFAGRIKYIDFETDHVDWRNAFNPVMVKRDSFSYENEYRVVYWDTGIVPPPEVKALIEKAQPNFWGLTPQTEAELIRRLQVIDLQPGFVAACDLDSLIEGIWISPSAPTWYLETIKLLCDRIGFSAKVKQSTLLDAPIF